MGPFRGYRTGAFVDSQPTGLLGGDRGFSTGFDSYEHAPFVEGSVYDYDARRTVDRAIEWLKPSPGPFFLFVHTKSVHATPSYREDSNRVLTPYHKPAEYMRRFISESESLYDWNGGLRSGVKHLRLLNERIALGEPVRDQISAAKLKQLIATYDGGIFYVDEQIGRLFRHMEASGLRENTIVIVTADHGAAFLDHRFFLHKELHRPLLRVPLLVYDPRNPGGSRRVSSPVSLLDVSPTVMALCGLEASSADEGRPLPAEDGDLPSRPFAFYSQIEDKDVYNGFGWQEGDWKLLAHRLSGSESTVIELFDTASDPEERAPVKSEPQRAAEMAARMRAWFYGAMEGGSTLDLDAEAIENLRALGYVK